MSELSMADIQQMKDKMTEDIFLLVEKLESQTKVNVDSVSVSHTLLREIGPNACFVEKRILNSVNTTCSF